MIQLSEPGWAEDTPCSLSFYVLLTSPIPRCNDTAEGFLCRPPDHVTAAPAGGMQGSKSLLNQPEPAQPSPAWISSSSSSSSSKSHLSLHLFYTSIWGSIYSAIGPDNQSNVQNKLQEQPSLPASGNTNVTMKRRSQSMHQCVFNCKNSKCAWLILPTAEPSAAKTRKMHSIRTGEDITFDSMGFPPS